MACATDSTGAPEAIGLNDPSGSVTLTCDMAGVRGMR
jgi:hypothetical protein